MGELIMNKLIETLKCKPNFYAEIGASITQIEQAEKALGLTFAFEFKECLREFGAVSFGSHEFTGFSADKSLDVVEVTQRNWNKHNVEKHLYVIEETHIDGIVVWQDFNGAIYETIPGKKAKKIADSLYEYITR